MPASRPRIVVLVLLVVSSLLGLAAPAHAVVFSNATAIPIPDNGQASSTILVSGLASSTTDVNVSLSGFGHSFPADIDVLVVGPTGANVLLMSDVPHDYSPCDDDVSGVALVFDDEASGPIPSNATLASGTYTPTNTDDFVVNCGNTSDAFVPPAPAGPYGSALSAFDGTDPNGTWTLYARDDSSADTGSVAGGWSLDITAGSGASADLTIIKGVSRDPVATGETFTYGFRVSNAGPATATGVQVVDTLPDEVSFVSAAPSQGSCLHNTGVVTCNLGSITMGTRATVQIKVTAVAGGEATNTAVATANESDPTTPNQASATTTINPPPAGPPPTLTVQRLGNGRGSVVSQPAGISCGTDCSEVYGAGATVVLKARPRAGTVFGGWGGACSGTNLTCTLTMDADKNVTATFTAV